MLFRSVVVQMTNPTALATAVPVAPLGSSLPARKSFQYYGCSTAADVALLSLSLGVMGQEPGDPSPVVEHEFQVVLDVPTVFAQDYSLIKRWAENSFGGYGFLGFYDVTGMTCPVGGYSESDTPF